MKVHSHVRKLDFYVMTAVSIQKVNKKGDAVLLRECPIYLNDV